MNGNSSSNEPGFKGSIVFVVDDDASMRDALSNLLRSVGIRVETFASTAEFLRQPKTECPSCLVLDVRLQGASGLDFQAQLAESDSNIPIIFITGHGDIEMSVKAMKAGAVDFLAKPFREQNLLDAVSAALQADVRRRQVEQQFSDLHARYQTLTVREKRGHGFCGHGADEQANCRADEPERNHREDPSRPRHEKKCVPSRLRTWSGWPKHWARGRVDEGSRIEG